MVCAGTLAERELQRLKSRWADKMDIRAKIDGDRRSEIGERKVGESNVMFLINNEGRMIDRVEETF